MDSRLEDLLADKMNLERILDSLMEGNNVTRQTHKRQ